MPVRMAVDIGGTFVDCIGFDRDTGEVSVEKTPTTPDDPAKGVLASIDGIDIDSERVEAFVHGTTLGLNAFLEREGARVGLITNEQFSDILEIGRYDRPAADMYELPYEGSEELVPRRRRVGVPGRIDADGSIAEDLDESAVAHAVDGLVEDEGVEAIAVCLLHSYQNPSHERRVAAIVADRHPDVSVSVSTDITQEYREYERTSTTVLDAYIKPIFESYVTDLESDLRDRGIDGRFLITRSGGGALAAANAKSAPVHTILSGPAGGLIGASAVGELLDEPNLIAADMGGTSLDTCVVRDGSPAVAYETSLGHVPVMLPVYDIRTIGAGGGSIAWLDEGLLKVGPESAGADPGPVCYDRGGTAPTVTDAAVTLGYLDPAAFLGGEMELAADSARTAIERELADPLGMDVQSASEGIYEVTRAKTSNALREITVEKGLDPRDFSMVAYGGAGPMFMPLVAREVGVETVIVPQAPALFSAWGMLMAEVVYDFSKTVVRQLDGMSVEELDGQFRDLEAEARETLAGEGIPEENRVFERSVAMRYYGQEHSVVVSADDISSLGDLESAFEMEHESQYGHTMDDPAEVVHLRVRGRGETERPEVRSEDPSEDPSPVGTRDAYCFAKERRTEFAVYKRGPLGAGADIDGPAIVREPTTTVVLQSDQAASVTRYGHLLISGGEQS